jgi:hypothetical protein
MKAKAVAVVVLGACVVVSGALSVAVEGQGKKKPMTLTGADYGEIQVLNARYTHAIDSCSNDGYDYADLYTPDGTFIDMWTQKAIDAGGEKWQGREKLREISSGANVTGAPCTPRCEAFNSPTIRFIKRRVSSMLRASLINGS